MQAARRVTRAIFLASAPGQEAETRRGVDIARIKLGVALPRDILGNFDSALNRLTAESRYLYGSDNRYWYDTKPNLNREAVDRAQRYEEYEVTARIEETIRDLVKQRSGFRAVHVTGAGGDVPDEDAVRLVVLPHEKGYKRSQGDESGAVKQAKAMLANRGNAPRTHKNMLIFLAAGQDAVKAMTDAARKALAWSSIVKDGDQGKLNLDNYGRTTAHAQLKEASDALPRRIDEAYKWIITPEQVTGTDPWTFRAEARNGGTGDSLAAKVFAKLETDSTVITRWSPAVLKLELDKWFFTKANHVSTKKVWETLTTYGYVPRLASVDVLKQTIADGLHSTDFFGYASSISSDGRFEGLRFGQSATVLIDTLSLLVRPDAAIEQIEAERIVIGGDQGPDQPPPDDVRTRIETGTATATGMRINAGTEKPPERVFNRYWGSVQVDASRPIPEFGEIVKDVIQHLSGTLGASVTISIEIEAKTTSGFSETVRRTVSENANGLRFKENQFSDE